MSHGRLVHKSLFGLAVLFLFCSLILIGRAVAAENGKEKDTGPERGIAVYTEYSGMFVSQGESVRMDITADNKGRTDENITLTLTTVPQGWKTSIKGPNYVVNSVPVPGRKNRVLTFAADPEKGIKPGSYLFQVDARTADGKFTSSQTINVVVREKTAVADDLQITTSYPVLKGQTDAKFEFSLDVTNKSETDKNFSLTAMAPEKWEVNFKPAYEQKQISSLRIKGGQNQSVSVEVTPAKEAQAGSYPILVYISSGEKKAEVKLSVVLTGTYTLDAGTPTGILSLESYAGKPANMSFFVKNTGSAVNRNIAISSFKPENWKVEFKPDKIDTLAAGEMKQVEVTITPSAQALVGDYSVGLSVEGEKNSSKTVEIRVSVKTSSAWGWVGIIIILLVIAGLGGLFLWLGRR
ncbi:MAG: hypothetical protein HY742_06540 [Deltaproteobacteria bacterium]|nr:hypothetical protein [Deltaproteobacteria bacterium]